MKAEKNNILNENEMKEVFGGRRQSDGSGGRERRCKRERGCRRERRRYVHTIVGKKG